MIVIETHDSDSPLTGRSKWWGEPDMPDTLDWPGVVVTDEDGNEYNDPLTFICQLRCDELASFDADGLLPHEGMLYFFGALDYFLGDFDTHVYPGMGVWSEDYYRVLYTSDCENLHTHHLNYPNGTLATMPAEEIIFKYSDIPTDGIRLLGPPCLDEVCEAMPNMCILLQIDENERWNLLFHDCGMLSSLISPQNLIHREWARVACYLHSF